jgi:hypothetical protein
VRLEEGTSVSEKNTVSIFKTEDILFDSLRIDPLEVEDKALT